MGENELRSLIVGDGAMNQDVYGRPSPPGVVNQWGAENAGGGADCWYNSPTLEGGPEGSVSVNTAQGGVENPTYSNIQPPPAMIRTETMNEMYMGGDEDFANEPPLLEELDINFRDIMTKTLAVLQPFKPVDNHIVRDSDLTGPLIFFGCLGFCLLLSGKIHFGHIYSCAIFGCVSVYLLLNLMSPADCGEIDVLCVASILGYCLLPITIVSLFGIVFTLSGAVGNAFALLAVVWCTVTATRLFEQALSMKKQRLLIAYPVGLLYSCFVLMTIF
uniref:Protein YIPF n=1 Tax=Octactis speculum TaxID=3111310 RepID=A0A7S2G127_9STRA|mmetsp:Transcript_36329/g.49148  ORF Transcript_36329/g.49148 Transcript_36329/m.49148 type:complete len:274 (+) Transcript_36329:58-879(+)|eukprot:CAMPEP_0185771776 /NCGR_PEP_ID=MMETSP1174-20130828/65089_1 /TAXON_ID=35687 /ORGANISM="Dictyocha speculum, Strain CCMP1381" /LENGTH=273 /DNA_ID=CAMNT_0028457741 /DNA_START=50 /DNA_END=871 /DNA_ORIENTATION=-